MANNTIQLKRGNLSRWQEVNPVLASGEVGFVIDLNAIKIGDGVKKFDELDYIGGSSSSGNVVVFGYYDSELDVFWKEKAKINPLPRLDSKVYKDIDTGFIYCLLENKYEGLISAATEEKYGIIKLYASLGQNIDGSVTQKLITEKLNSKCSVPTVDGETVIFTA